MTPLIPNNLRINADDFGLSPSINRTILMAAQAGLVNSVSVVPFMDGESESHFNQLLQIPGLHIGAHLTFLEIPLITKPPNFPEGFPPKNYLAFIKAYLKGRVHTEDVFAEWQAQINLLRSRMGSKRSISHLDSHQHLHLLPGLSKLTRTLQAEFRIPLIRIPLEKTVRAYTKDFPFGLALQILSLTLRKTPHELFFGVGTSMAFRAQTYFKMATQVKDRTKDRFEMMVHLGENEQGQKEFQEIKKWLEYLALLPRA